MKSGRIQRVGGRRWRRWLAALVGAFALLGLTIPVWFPWVLRPVGRAVGLRFETSHREGYWRLRLEDVHLSQPGLAFEAANVQLLQPLGWLVERFFPGALAAADAPALSVDDWQAGFTSVPTDAPPENDSTAAVLDQVAATGELLSTWLGPARLRSGTVRLANQTLTLSEVKWDGAGRLSAVAASEALVGDLAADIVLGRDPAIEITVRHALGAVEVALRRTEALGWEIAGEATGGGQRLSFEGRFGGQGWLPERASIKAPELQWPVAWIERPEVIEACAGELTAVWETNQFRSHGTVAATVAAGGLSRQTFTFNWAAEGDAQQITVRSLDLTSDALRAGLTSPVRCAFAEWPNFSGLQWQLAADLDLLNLASLSGTLTGELEVEPRKDSLPAAQLSLAGNGLEVQGQPLAPLVCRAALRWPWLELETLELGNGEARLTAGGRLDLARGEWDAGQWQLRNLPQILAPHLQASNVMAGGELMGPWLNPRHRGSARLAGLELPGLEPMALELSWEGEGMQATNLQLSATAKQTAWVVNGEVQVAGPPSAGVQVRLRQCDLTRAEETLLELAEPAEWTLGLAGNEADDAASAFGLSLAGITLEGESRRLALAGNVQWPVQGRLRVEAAGLRPDDLRDFLSEAPAWIRLGGLDLAAGWTNGPVQFDAQATLGLEAAPDQWLDLEAKLTGRDEEVRVEGIELRRDGATMANLSGRVPLVIEPGNPDPVRLRPYGNLEARVSVDESASLWSELGARFGLLVERPELDLQLTGSAATPNGRLRFTAEKIRSANSLAGFELPALEGPRIEVNLDESGLLRADGEGRLAGQRGVLTARLPLDLAGLTNGTVAFDRSLLEPLEASLRLPAWDLAPLAAMFPDYLSPQGTLDVTATVQPGLAINADLWVTNAATRPIAPIGVLRQIAGHVQVDPDGLQLEGGRAELSGQPVAVAGAWRFADGETNAMPPLRFTLSGTNLALARRADLFLRGDVALVLTGRGLTNATVAGEVKLRNSLLLRDLQSLVSGNIQEPASRPPYFSVQPAPWGDWRLDLRVQGDRFLRVVTPVFRGRVSSGLQLTGTLREPVALGDVTVPEGRISFPFGGLNVENGRVSLSRENPFIPQISFQASGLNFGFDVRMDVSGPATTPNVVFSSVPPLTSTQILLMLTSGDIPSQTFSYSARSRLQSIAIFIGKEFIGKLTGDPESDRLTMRSGERVSDRGQLTYTIEYRLSPRWSVFGMQDRFDTYLGGVKWRVYAK